MIQLYIPMTDPISKKEFQLLICGITKMNIRKLVDEKLPMRIECKRSIDCVVVVYGENKPDILRQLKEVDIEIPDAVLKEAEENPE